MDFRMGRKSSFPFRKGQLIVCVMGTWNSLHTGRDWPNDAGTLQEGLSKWNNAYTHLAIWKAAWEDTRQGTLLLLCLWTPPRQRSPSERLSIGSRVIVSLPCCCGLPPVSVVSPGPQSEITESVVGTFEQSDPLQTRTNFPDFFSF